MSKLKIFHQEVFILIINPKFNVNIFASNTKSPISLWNKALFFHIFIFKHLWIHGYKHFKPSNVIPIKNFRLVINFFNNIIFLNWGQNVILKISYFAWILGIIHPNNVIVSMCFQRCKISSFPSFQPTFMESCHFKFHNL
jgi:hypothetical protein